MLGKENQDKKILVGKQGANVKIEPNYRIRELFSEPEKLELCPYLQDRFNRRVQMTCVSKEELFAGKLCAALNRQHPRDLFDVWLHLKENKWFSSEYIAAFVVYLICQGGQIHETLNPNFKEVKSIFENQFIGMSSTQVTLDHLENIQKSLPSRIVKSLPDSYREFLVGFKNGVPDWSRLPYSKVQDLPAIRYKMKHLEKMDCKKRQIAIDKLQQIFDAIPYATPTFNQ